MFWKKKQEPSKCKHIWRDERAEYLGARAYSRCDDNGVKYDNGITCYYAIYQVCIICKKNGVTEVWVDHSQKNIYDDLVE